MHNFLNMNIQHFIDKLQGNIKRFHMFTQIYSVSCSLVQVMRWAICHAVKVKVGERGGGNYRELSPLKKNNTNNKNQPQNTNRFLINMYLLTRMEHTKTEEQTGLLSQQTHTTLKLSPKLLFFFFPSNSFFLWVIPFLFHITHNYMSGLASLDLHLFLLIQGWYEMHWSTWIHLYSIMLVKGLSFTWWGLVSWLVFFQKENMFLKLKITQSYTCK